MPCRCVAENTGKKITGKFKRMQPNDAQRNATYEMKFICYGNSVNQFN